MSYKKILCFGSLNPDLIYFVDELPKRGDDIRSSNSLIRAGGTAINCAEKIVLWNKLVHVRGNSLGTDPMGNYLIDYLKSKNINHDSLIINESDTPTCSIFIDSGGERTIISSGYQKLNWNNFENISSYDSLMLDRYSIEFVREDIKKIKSNTDLFISQAGYEYEIDYKLDFLTVSKDEISVSEANELIESEVIRYILLTSSNLPVSNIETTISLYKSSVIKSPMLTGITAKTLPADTLCKPVTLISSKTQDSDWEKDRFGRKRIKIKINFSFISKELF